MQRTKYDNEQDSRRSEQPPAREETLEEVKYDYLSVFLHSKAANELTFWLWVLCLRGLYRADPQSSVCLLVFDGPLIVFSPLELHNTFRRALGVFHYGGFYVHQSAVLPRNV